MKHSRSKLVTPPATLRVYSRPTLLDKGRVQEVTMGEPNAAHPEYGEALIWGDQSAIEQKPRE